MTSVLLVSGCPEAPTSGVKTPSLHAMARDAGMSLDQFMESLAEASQKGWIQVVRSGSGEYGLRLTVPSGRPV